MKFLFVFLSSYLLIKSVFGGCHTGTTSADDRRLGIETNDDIDQAGSDAKIFANIYADGKWNGWRSLNNTNCDDFRLGAVDYFDDFESITSEWEAISLYNCGNDGLLIETIYYWDGSNERQTTQWKPGVFGPFPAKCLYNDASHPDPANPSNFWYSDILIDGDTECCDGVTFGTSTIGSVWTGTLPGIPDCSATEYGADVPVWHHNEGKPPISNNKYNNNYNPINMSPATSTSSIFEHQFMNYLMIVIAIALLSFVSNSCLITFIVKNNANKDHGYGKIYKADME